MLQVVVNYPYIMEARLGPRQEVYQHLNVQPPLQSLSEFINWSVYPSLPATVQSYKTCIQIPGTYIKAKYSVSNPSSGVGRDSWTQELSSQQIWSKQQALDSKNNRLKNSRYHQQDTM